MILPNEGALRVAGVVRTEFLLAEVRLYKAELVPDNTTTLADLDAVEADFDGYAAQVVTWNAARLLTGGGAIFGGCVQFDSASPFGVPNSIGGWYLVDVTGTDVCVGIQPYSPAIPMGDAGQSIPVEVSYPITG